MTGKNSNIDVDKIVKHWIETSDDDYKKEFYKLCTPEYTKNWIERIKIIRTWIKEML